MAPAIMLNSVVLPAPFGPITAKIAPCGTAKLTRSTATQAAEALADRVERQERAHRLRSVTPSRRASHGHTPSGSADDDEKEADAVEHLLRAGQIDAECRHGGIERFGEAVSTNAPRIGPNSVPTPPMIGPRMISIEREMLKTCSGNRLL